MPAPLDLVIRNGMIVSSAGTRRADIGIRGEAIVAITTEAGLRAGVELDATGKYVLPGIIDAHTHPVYADDMATMCAAGAAAGVTTVMAFVGAFPSWGFTELSTSDAVDGFVSKWDGRVCCDFGVHAALGPRDNVRREIPLLVSKGVASFKFFMAYRARKMMVDDRFLLRGMKAIAAIGGIAMVHAENGDGIAFLESAASRHRPVENKAFLKCHTSLFESEALLRAIALADAAGCPVYLPHVSAKDGLRAVRIGRGSASIPIWVETCPHYLTHTNDDVVRRGALSKVAPPIRLAQDRAALWRAIRAGEIQTIGSDHAGRTLEMKQSGDILRAPYGAEGIEHLLQTIYTQGVHRGRLSVEGLVSVLAEKPADIFGFAPRKGRLTVGADADIVVFDPSARSTCSAAAHRGASDYCLYDGIDVVGSVTATMCRGRLVYRDGELESTPSGRFIARTGGIH